MIKIGMIGAGGIASAHSEAIRNNPDCVLTAVCDIDIKKAEKIAKSHEAVAVVDYKKIENVDAVIINLPHYLHCEVSCWFLRKNVHVMVEKPMANTVEECDEMIKAAKENGAKLSVGHVQRYYLANSRLKNIIESEKFGKLCMITEVRNTDYLAGRPGWFLNKKMSGGGILMNYGAHSLDRIFYTTGKKVIDVHSVISNPVSEDDVEVNAQILFELEDNITASVTLCGCHVPNEYEISYYFTHGAVKVKNGQELLIYENGEYVNYGGEAKLMELQLVEFIKYLKGEENEMVTPEYGREVIKILKRIV